MDTSKEYIEMCKNAVEIHREYDPKECDIFACYSPHFGEWEISANHDLMTESGSAGLKYTKCGKVVVWLPRQDQLQALIRLESNFACNYVGMLNSFASDYIIYLSNFNSMEQIWLAFVMFERYNKVWTGKGWTLKEIT